MYSAFVVLWTGVQRESLRERFDSLDLAHRWVYEQRLAHGRSFVSGFVV